MELWDAYDSTGNILESKTLVRGKPIPDGMYHLVCDILVRHTDGTYLLTQRHKDKHFGGMWEASAGGSAMQGETPLACAKRELLEETRLSGDFQELGRVIHHHRHTIYVVYLCTTHEKAVHLQENETQAYRWVDRETFLRIPKQDLVTTRVQALIEELQR